MPCDSLSIRVFLYLRCYQVKSLSVVTPIPTESEYLYTFLYYYLLIFLYDILSLQ